jgi:hypothetical protein
LYDICGYLLELEVCRVLGYRSSQSIHQKNLLIRFPLLLSLPYSAISMSRFLGSINQASIRCDFVSFMIRQDSADEFDHA